MLISGSDAPKRSEYLPREFATPEYPRRQVVTRAARDEGGSLGNRNYRDKTDQEKGSGGNLDVIA